MGEELVAAVQWLWDFGKNDSIECCQVDAAVVSRECRTMKLAGLGEDHSLKVQFTPRAMQRVQVPRSGVQRSLRLRHSSHEDRTGPIVEDVDDIGELDMAEEWQMLQCWESHGRAGTSQSFEDIYYGPMDEPDAKRVVAWRPFL